MLQRKLKIIHIEDEPAAAKVLKGFAQNVFSEEVEYVALAVNLSEAVGLLENEDFDMIFLDIQLPDGSGLQLIDKYPIHASQTVLCTADDTKGIEALKKGVFDYLLKPINILELRECFEKFRNREMTVLDSDVGAGKMVVPDANGIELVTMKDVVCMVSDRNYTNIHLIDGSHIFASKTLKYFADQMDEHKFLRVHKSHVVNIEHVKRINKIKGGSVEMSNGVSLKLSPTGKDLLRQRLKLS